MGGTPSVENIRFCPPRRFPLPVVSWWTNRTKHHGSFSIEPATGGEGLCGRARQHVIFTSMGLAQQQLETFGLVVNTRRVGNKVTPVVMLRIEIPFL
jgi:hypothetical protein